MAKTLRTGFDAYFQTRMKDPDFATAYTTARSEIREVDRLVRFLDYIRVAADIPKAELARRIRATPEIVRRLFTSKAPNPTLTTMVKLADALGLRLELVPKTARPSLRRGGHPRQTRLRKKTA